MSIIFSHGVRRHTLIGILNFYIFIFYKLSSHHLIRYFTGSTDISLCITTFGITLFKLPAISSFLTRYNIYYIVPDRYVIFQGIMLDTPVYLSYIHVKNVAILSHV